MKKPIRNIVIRLSVLVTAILLATPCFLKGEIKTSLGIPLSEISSRQLATGSCVCIGSDYLSERPATFLKKQEPPAFGDSEIFHRYVIKAAPPTVTPLGRPIPTPIPIYILYERYLI